MKTEIVYEDDAILVIYKPAGLAVQSARVGQMDVVSELKNYLRTSGAGGSGRRAMPYLGIVHRLDQPVEGLLVFAKDKKAAEALCGQLRQGDGGMFHKQYCAVVCGGSFGEEGELVDFLSKDKENRAVVTDGQVPGAKRAVLQYRILQTREVGQGGLRSVIALADIRIRTGRFHQIRAQMAHAGMPLLGDQKYGNQGVKELSEELTVPNVALCAYELALRHPASRKQMDFCVEPRGRAFSLFANSEE